MLYTHLLNLAAHYTCLNCCAKVHLKRFVSSSSKAELNLRQRQMNKCSISNLTVRCRLWAHGLFFAEHWNTFAGNSVGCGKHLCTLALGRPLGVAIPCKLQHEGFVGPHSLVCFPCRHPKGVCSENMNSDERQILPPHEWGEEAEKCIYYYFGILLGVSKLLCVVLRKWAGGRIAL